MNRQDGPLQVGGLEKDTRVATTLTLDSDERLRVTPDGSVSPVTPSNVPSDAVAVKKYYTNAGAVTDGIVWSPASGKRWYVGTLAVNVSAASVVTLEDDLTAGDSPVFKMDFAGNSGAALPFNPALFSTEDASDLLVTTTAGTVYITITGWEG
jgi:hypothetical protein